MTMQSSSLLPALQELPGGESGQRRSLREQITGLVNMDRAMYAAEFASAVSVGLWGIFPSVNVDDRLFEAYETRWPGMSDDHSLYEQVQRMIENGQLSDPNNWLFIGLKGKLAEFNSKDWLESNSFTDVTFPPTEVNPGWDIRAIDLEGQEVFISVKTGGINEDTGVAEYARDVIKEMDANPTFDFMVGSEVYDVIAESRLDLVDQIVANIGYDYELVGGITDGLNTLSDNMGIDIPDGVGEIIPYAGAIIAGARLVYSVIKTEKEFKAADRTTRNKIQVVQSLTVMSRLGVTTVMATAGGMAGTAAGSVLPGPGNLIGGIVGSTGGAGIGMYLNKHLQPHMLNLALDITALTNDDLFYYKNKSRIDMVAWSFQTTARELAAAPA